MTEKRKRNRKRKKEVILRHMKIYIHGQFSTYVYLSKRRSQRGMGRVKWVVLNMRVRGRKRVERKRMQGCGCGEGEALRGPEGKEEGSD